VTVLRLSVKSKGDRLFYAILWAWRALRFFRRPRRRRPHHLRRLMPMRVSTWYL
jgi:hypothetical protein